MIITVNVLTAELTLKDGGTANPGYFTAKS